MMNRFFRFFLLCTCVFSIVPSYASEQDEMLASEKNTIEIFQKFSPKVVFVHRLSEVPKRTYEKMHVTTGAGSGIIWDSQGHIVTNFHVINGADKLMITLDNKTLPVRVIGAEPRKDIAVLKITSEKAQQSLKSFIPFELASTNNLQVGQKVIAIGNPFGLDHSLTTGVISALGRQVPGIGGVTIRDMIQTDASINPGNSGGPLLDSKGRLLGMNTVIYSNSGASAGVGFAVPADDIQRIVPQLIKNGRVVLAGLGIHRVEPGIASRLGVRKGILIADVLPRTPAQSIGLRGTYRDNRGRIQLGDVIVALNGHPVRNYDDLYNLLTGITVGERVNLTVNRHNKIINYSMKTIDIAAY